MLQESCGICRAMQLMNPDGDRENFDFLFSEMGKLSSRVSFFFGLWRRS